jgi:hypothetical protein
MAELDTSIPLGIKVPEYDPMGDAYKIAQIRNAQQAYQANNLTLQEKQRTLGEQQGLRNMLASGIDPLSPEGQKQAFMIAPNLGPTFVKTALEAQEVQRKSEAAKTDLLTKNLGFARSVMPGVTNQDQLDKYLDYVKNNVPNILPNIPTTYSEFDTKRPDLMKTADQALANHFFNEKGVDANSNPTETLKSVNMYGPSKGATAISTAQQPVELTPQTNNITGDVSMLNKYTGAVTPTYMGGQANPAANAGAPAGVTAGPQSFNSSAPAVMPQQIQQSNSPGAGLYNQARARDAIAGPESGGRYDAVGPVTKNGDRAYGKYQMMGNNIPQWTKEALGVSMTPQEFMKNKEAQDAVFDYKFGQAVAKYGNVQDAASVWFSGRPMSQAGNASDVLGTTVPQYVRNFMTGYQNGPATPRMAVAQPFVSNADIPMGPGQPSMPTTGFQPQPTNALAPQQQTAQNALLQQNQPTTTTLTPYQMQANKAPAQPVAPVAPTSTVGQPYSTGNLAQKAQVEEQAKRENALPAAKASISNVLSNFQDTIKDINELKNHEGLDSITGPINSRTFNYSDKSNEAQALLNRIRSSGALEKLTELRNESTSGGTNLRITQGEFKTVTDAFAALDQAQPTPAMKKNLEKAANILTRISGNLSQQYEDTYAYRGEKAPTIQSNYVSPSKDNTPTAKGSTYSNLSDAEIKAKLGIK